ncbi:MAG: hypothetical protein DRH89_03270 [Candidatus Cloacimonadota bacterium]|nr:MAG: hypothetical protein DRI23_01025 [Candidatus Cloacimonadota bacterium]RLC57545.1 MAG: hypothetical protein DRH89_03270 [Candidatus Cloacimonadota bacterium]
MRKKDFWCMPFGYAPTFILIIGFVLVGFALEIATGSNGFPKPIAPLNLSLIVIYFLILISLNFVKSFRKYINWLSSITMAVSSAIVYIILIAIAGFLPQGGGDNLLQKIGFTHMISSWPYVFSLLFVCTALFYTILKKLMRFKVKYIGFLLRHIGFFIILFFGSLSVGNIEKYNIELFIDSPTHQGFYFDKLRANEIPEFPDQKLIKRNVSLPFSLEMKRFEIDNYPSEILFYDSLGFPVKTKLKKEAGFVGIDKTFNFKDWEITVKKYLESATPRKDDFIPYEIDCDHPAFLSAAYLKAKNVRTKEEKEGWVTCGNVRSNTPDITRMLMRLQYYFPATYLDIGEYSVTIGQPGKKRFASFITMQNEEGKKIEKIVEVNKPFKYKSWYLYQTNCHFRLLAPKSNEPLRVSTLQAVRDPWLKVVYIGFFMLLAGSIHLIWSVRKFPKGQKK